MTDKPGRWDAYGDAVLRIEAPGGAIRVRRMPVSRTTGKYPDPEDRTIYVITAHNPCERLVSDAENAAAQARLAAELDRRGLTWWPATGGNRPWTHVEASAAVIGLDTAEAIALGTQFGQDAIFALTPTERQVLGCAEMRVASTGWSIEPEPGVAAAANERWLPEGVTTSVEKDKDPHNPEDSEPRVDRPAELTKIVALERPAAPVTSAAGVETEDEDEEAEEDGEGVYESVSICEENFLMEHVARLKAKLPAHAHRMAEALDYIARNPGVCKADVFRGTGVRRSTDGDDPINRLLRRGLVYNLGSSHRYALYGWSSEDAARPKGYYTPGHP